MADIGYVYNRSAATLRSASSGMIGLVINDLRNPFFTEFAALFQMELARNGYATVLANTDEDPALQTQMISSLVEHGVSGFIVSPSYGNEQKTLAVLGGLQHANTSGVSIPEGGRPKIPFQGPRLCARRTSCS